MESKCISKDNLKQVPMLPGIYKMLDSKGTIIYIGKSKCLRKRIQSYFVSTPKWEKVKRMVALIYNVEYTVTDTHLEARLLECRLIKEIKPRFNAQMKNDQRYFFIKIENYNRYHPLSISEERTDLCFGPFRGKFTIQEFLVRLKNIYPITKCDNKYEFDYHMFPVTMEEGLYNQNKEMLFELFSSENNLLLFTKSLQKKMEDAVDVYRYELASVYRNMIQGFMMIRNGLDGYKALVTRNILLKLPIETGYKLFLIKNGYIVDRIIVDNLTKETIDHFINNEASNITVNHAEYGNEKTWIDYRDVLYSEISDLPEEMVELL